MESKLGKGKAISLQSREIVLNVYHYCCEEKMKAASVTDLNLEKSVDDEDSYFLVPPGDVTFRVSKMTGVGVSTVKRIVAEFKKDEKLTEPKKRATWKGVSSSVDEFDEASLRRMIHGMYTNAEHVTLNTILSRVREELDITISRSCLRKIILRIGFRFRKVDNRKILMEKPAVVAARARFLRRMRQIRVTNPRRPIIYLDETWYNQYDCLNKAWLDDGEVTGRKPSVGKGKRMIIVHAGSCEGFVPNALLTVCTDGKSTDYHDSMNSQSFEEWFMVLLKNIPSGSAIIMDNAPYHSRQKNKPPTSSSKKGDIRAWLSDNHIAFDEAMLKAELLDLVRRESPVKHYHVDEIAREHGHEVVRLAPYNCDLNPIEMIWSQVKGYVRARNQTGQMAKLQTLIQEAVDTVTPDTWMHCCEHVIKKEKEYWRMDCIADEVQQCVISVGDDSSSDSESESE